MNRKAESGNGRRTSAAKLAQIWSEETERRRAYRIPAVPIDFKARLTTETRRQADLAFEEIKRSAILGKYKIDEKRRFFQCLIHALKRADYVCGCVRYHRNMNRPECTKARLQVIQAAVKANFAKEYRSPPGSPKTSRLIPTGLLVEQASIDPWTFDPFTEKQLVFLRKRERTQEEDNREEIPFDQDGPIPAKVQKRLERINQVNNLSEIINSKYDEWESRFTTQRRLRPVHYAVFTDTFDLHGRLYTGKYGHQGLRKLERQTITFDGESGVELDYGGFHCRLLYHQEGVDYTGDPY